MLLSIDILNFRVFSKASAKINSFLYLSMERAGVTICHILASLAPQDYNKSEAAEETEELN